MTLTMHNKHHARYHTKATQSGSAIGTLAQQDVRRRRVGMRGIIGLAECVLKSWNWLGNNFKLQKDSVTTWLGGVCGALVQNTLVK